ncbi:MAG: NADH-quinone oxidoreductase subunit L [Dehalococcoidia bacterium]|nr:NADH-quinone oxidoreductase subunit L [Dehalococcoidia bacterium]
MRTGQPEEKDVELAWLIPALSACAAVFIAVPGRALPRWVAVLAPLAILAGFVLFWVVLADFLDNGAKAFSITWLEAGSLKLVWGTFVDPLAVVMLGIVTFIAFGIQVYSWAYMKHEARFTWFFAVNALFAAAMLALVLADNLLFLYIAWELVGLCSYLLIGFYFERRSAAEAAKKAFVTTRIGDVGLLIGVLLLFNATGTFNIGEIIHLAETGAISGTTLTASMLLIFAGAAGKSAQVPFHVWLPDAMEGPTPVSALIHAATMVVAGVYLVARLFPAFEAASGALLLIAIVGLITVLISAFLALVMTDLKRVLAYSTISHLGFMMLALGTFGVGAAIFHLLVHAFAKAMLFLSAGSVSHGTNKLDIRELGGLRKRMPWTTLCFLLGALSLAGLPPLSGFFSKDEMLVGVWHSRGAVFLFFTLVAAFLSALYMARVTLLTFFGPLKHENEHAHESPPAMLAPMLAFGVMTVVVGFLALPLAGDFKGFAHFIMPDEEFHFKIWLATLSSAVAAAGLALGWLMYSRGAIAPSVVRDRAPALQRLLENKYYMDAGYQWVIDHVVLVAGRFVALFDRVVVNDTAVNGTGASVVASGTRLRQHVTGLVANYALAMAVGAVAVAVAIWAVALAR